MHKSVGSRGNICCNYLGGRSIPGEEYMMTLINNKNGIEKSTWGRFTWQEGLQLPEQFILKRMDTNENYNINGD